MNNEFDNNVCCCRCRNRCEQNGGNCHHREECRCKRVERRCNLCECLRRLFCCGR